MPTRREFLKLVGGASAAMLAPRWGGLTAMAADPADAASRYNVLFIGVDDLRPHLGCYGSPHAHSPHIDALAQRGTTFLRAYCQTPSCLPSRSSLLTGLRPDTTRVFNNADGHFREAVPDAVTLPQHFKQTGGCHAVEMGKVFHLRDRPSWSVDKWIPPAPAYPIYKTEPALRAQAAREGARDKRSDWWGHDIWAPSLAIEAPDVPDNALFDGMLADRAIEVLRRSRDQRFFISPGFFRPHLPFIAPKRYFDMFPLDRVPLPENREQPTDAPPWTTGPSRELRGYSDGDGPRPIPEQRQRELLRGYLASVAYVDAQIGRVLAALADLGLADNTVVMLWSDHGYHFGEHGTWGKNTNFEVATRSTLIAAAPDQRAAGGKAQGIVELVDMYPTLCDLCELPTPDGLEGVSFAPLLNEPGGAWKTAAFSQTSVGRRDGYSIRTDRHRLVEWRRGDEVQAIELYDHQTDPGENRNVADMPQYADAVEDLRRRLHAGWRNELPAA